MSSTPPPTSRRERPAKPALTRQAIVSAALDVVRREGLERLTMRRLATELDTGAASLYVYFRNAAELHAGVLDELLGTVDLGGGDGDWRTRLVGVLRSYTQVLLEQPSLARSAMVSRPSGPHYLALLEKLLALLAEGGVADDQAAWGVDLLLLHATSTAVEHGTRDGEASKEDGFNTLATALRTVPAASHPRIAALGDELLSGPGPDRLTWGFDVLINGIPRTPRPRR
ncbi:TetR family transcriptional regulator [Cystobacter fuscus]|uniref:TetR family transcriptional regulator n=1 Tax=Cystobacter fuscus TaxID=43 RepID=A0A250IYK0_9BACT|nr:TetR/AcrR family transcriptional regulator [Cystobacter fuscus]ATB36373.1 TetR family transcriptional regulator [Cystobacter fuscus]